MQYTLSDNKDISTLETDCLVVAVYADNELSDVAKILDDKSNGAISRFLELGDFTGKVEQLETLYQLDNIVAKRIMLIGLGEKDKCSLIILKKAAAVSSTALLKMNLQHATSTLPNELEDSHNTIQQCVLAHSEVSYQFEDFKSNKADAHTLATFNLSVQTPSDSDSAIQGGIAIAKGVAFAKDLANAPGNVCTPTYLAEQAMELAADFDKLEANILEESDMEALGMGSFLSVSKGSKEPGKMIVLEYKGGASDQAPVALVGKGITFDTGGISLKPGAGMDEMKYDMGGSASVLGTMRSCCELGLPINVVAVLAAAENMPSGEASKPGDIVTSMSGKTIEILNTDAEGRLVLCDALTYVGKYKPDAVIDVATLTGACIVALGHHISGLMSNNDELANELLNAGKKIQDQAWQLPMNEDYQAQLKSNFADIPNIGDRSAGTITAACFLSRFTEDYNWVHLDIAGTAWKSGAAKGATGRPVPLLTQFLINRSTA